MPKKHLFNSIAWVMAKFMHVKVISKSRDQVISNAQYFAFTYTK
jgi:hypothetical protein